MNKESLRYVVFHKATNKVVLVTFNEKEALDYIIKTRDKEGNLQYSYQWHFHD